MLWVFCLVALGVVLLVTYAVQVCGVHCAILFMRVVCCKLYLGLIEGTHESTDIKQAVGNERDAVISWIVSSSSSSSSNSSSRSSSRSSRSSSTWC